MGSYYEVVQQLQHLNQKVSDLSTVVTAISDKLGGLDRIAFGVTLIAFMVFLDKFIRRGWLNG